MATMASLIGRPIPTLRAVNALVGLGPRMVFRRPASGRAQPPKAKKFSLEKPDKFRPPSHPARLKKPRRDESLGWQRLSSEQKTRSYPKMMPNKGSFRHRIINSGIAHGVVCFVVLLSLASYVLYKDFATTTVYWHLLPPTSLLPWHPYEYVCEVGKVYKLHMHQQTEKLERYSRAKRDDIAKRSDYRVHHGLSKRAGFPWEDPANIPDEDLTINSPRNLEKRMLAAAAEREKAAQQAAAEGNGEEPVQEEKEERPKRKVRKWFGISWD